MKEEVRKIRGVFSFEKRNLKGEIIETYQSENLIVDKGRESMAKLISAAPNPYYINEIGFGLGTTAAVVGDTALTTPTTKAFDSVEYPDATSVKFNWSLDITECNGMAITEFGLISDNGDLFARKVRAAINKENDFTLTGSWKIYF